jgi:dihydrodipicolinate synthase/N-acetylneuraminate lyase
LELAAETARDFSIAENLTHPIMIAGIVGDTRQSVREAQLASELGYHIGLVSLTALRQKSVDELIEHTKHVSEVIPIMGFYLQQTISKMSLPAEFWTKLVEIPNVLAIKIAPFNRYQTLDVLEAVAHSGRASEIALYTGNDDNIIPDLLTQHEFNVEGTKVSVRIVGGLLGQWACWTRKAVECFAEITKIREAKADISQKMMTLAGQLTLANKAIFDADNSFAGCIAGISYVLKKQGLLDNTVTLNPRDRLSAGQTSMIDRVIRDYPHLTDDEFVGEHLHKWLAP